MRKDFSTILYLILCGLAVVMNIFRPDSFISIGIFGLLISVYLFTIIRKNWNTKRDISYLCIALIVFIIGWPVFLLSI